MDNRVPVYSNDEFLGFYNQGLTDKKIAEMMGMSRTSVRRYRWKMGLSPHGKDGVAFEPKVSVRAVNLSLALVPERRNKMIGFLVSLDRYHRKAVDSGETLDAVVFLEGYKESGLIERAVSVTEGRCARYAGAAG